MKLVETSSPKLAGEPLDVERSTLPSTLMNLLLRFETANGPRTVVASSVSLQTAREIARAMIEAGHHAEIVDRCTPLSITDRLMMRCLTPGQPIRRPSRQIQQREQDKSIVSIPA